MSFRPHSYTKPVYLEKFTSKQPSAIIDFGQLERRADYYRRRPGIVRHVISLAVFVFFVALFGVYGYFSLVPGSTFLDTESFDEVQHVAAVPPTVTPVKVVESVSLDKEEKTYSYTVQNGDSYARLVKRAVKEFSADQNLELTNSELNSTVYALVSGIDQQPLHPGDLFLLSSTEINDVLVTVKP